MSGFDDPEFFGERRADVYDKGPDPDGPDPGLAVDFLARLAGGSRVLGRAIGTGRVGLPLAGRGITVEGIEASAQMVERLRAKPGGEQIPVTIGDMADVPVTGLFGLVYLVFNTLFNCLARTGRPSASATSRRSWTQLARSSSNASCRTRPGSIGASASRRWR